jgi:toxin HigB-1
MIITFRHKGLQAFFLDGRRGKIQQNHVKKIRLFLAKLNSAVDISDMNFPGSGLHPLKGNMREFWAISVSGNWRIIFRFEKENAYDVDYVDYH